MTNVFNYNLMIIFCSFSISFVTCVRKYQSYSRKLCMDNEVSVDLLSSTSEISFEKCAIRCTKSGLQTSFFYNDLTKQCGLYSSAEIGLLFTMVETGWRFFHSDAECCGSDWSYFRGSCFQFQLSSTNWESSKSNCEHFGGFLAEPYREEIDTFLKVEKKKMGLNKDLWIGGSDSALEGHWVWIKSGRNFTYTNWKPNGEPNNLRGNEHCVVHGAEGTWRDVPCGRDKYSVCQKHIT